MKKIAILVVILMGLFVFTGCGNEEKIENVDFIKKEDIFNQKEKEYFVYFHRVDCPDCESSIPTVIQYEMARQEINKCQSKRKIYSVMLYTASEKPDEDTYIYRAYDGADGQGTDGKYFVNDVKKWDELYIATTSSLIAIYTDSSGEKYSRYSAQGANDVIEKLLGQLGECHR